MSVFLQECVYIGGHMYIPCIGRLFALQLGLDRTFPNKTDVICHILSCGWFPFLREVEGGPMKDFTYAPGSLQRLCCVSALEAARGDPRTRPPEPPRTN